MIVFVRTYVCPLSAGLNALAAGSLPCSLQPEVKPPGALPCQWPGSPPPRRTRLPCQALIREGGGYNEKPRAREACLFCVCALFPAPWALQWEAGGSWPEGIGAKISARHNIAAETLARARNWYS